MSARLYQQLRRARTQHVRQAGFAISSVRLSCPRCGAVFHKGRWTWESAPSGANEALCQACHRVNDAYPAGIVTLRGAFLKKHRVEILNLALNQEKLEKNARALHRIMAIEDKGEEIEITTTGIHLPRRIGQALHNAYEGEFDFHYDEEGYFIRVKTGHGKPKRPVPT